MSVVWEISLVLIRYCSRENTRICRVVVGRVFRSLILNSSISSLGTCMGPSSPMFILTVGVEGASGIVGFRSITDLACGGRASIAVVLVSGRGCLPGVLGRL